MIFPLVDNAIGFIRDIYSSFFVDKNDKLQADVKMKEFDTKIQALKESGELEQKAKQYDLAIAEAQHRSIFVAGWRPSIGWICSISLGLVWIPQFSLASYFWILECFKVHHFVTYPINISELMCMIGTLLPTAILRSFDKWKGVTK